MNIKINKCIKITLKKCLNEDTKKIKQIIRDFNYMSCKASNKAITMWYNHTKEIMEMKAIDNNFNIKTYEKEKYGKSYRNVIEGEMKLLMPIANTSNVGTLHQQLVQNDWGRLKKDVLNYRASLPTYKLDTPYFIKNDSYKLRNNGGWFVSIAFYNKQGLVERGLKVGHKYEFEIDKMDGNKKATITKLINGEYKQGSAQISISKKNKIELIISFGFEKQIKEEEQLDKNRILGIDLGIVKVATMSIWDNNKQDWDKLKYNDRVIDGAELIAFRQKYYNLRRNLSIASKIVGEGRIGHGYKCRMKPVNKIRDKIANFSDLYNHKVSKYIVEFAVKNKCGVIQMEDLSGATKEVEERFLKEWSYYDLQQKIEYKAKEYGIEVIKINPKYTSKRCSKCGCIHVENRDCKNDQAKFECKICGHKENADINASKNIAVPFIDKIIEETEVQGV